MPSRLQSRRLRKMDSLVSSTGSAPPWTPILLSPTVWFRADKSTGSGASLTLTDLSGNGYNATVANGTDIAIISNVINGQPVVRFSTLGDYMAFAGGNQLVTLGSAATFIVVSKASAVLGTNGVANLMSFNSDAATPNQMCFQLLNFSGYADIGWGGSYPSGSTAMEVGITVFDYYSAFFGLVAIYNGGNPTSASSWTAYSNGNAQTLATSGNINVDEAVSLIAARGNDVTHTFLGDIAEIILIPSVVSGANLTQLQAYLMTRYGV